VSDFDDRLAALDPAAAQPYQHRNLDDLISRVTAQPRHARRRVWKNIELKIGGTLIAGSLVAAGALALFQTTPGLPALALQNASTKFAVASPFQATMQRYAEYDFFGRSELSTSETSAPSALSYRLAFPKDGAQEAARIASVFGVSGSPVNTKGNGSDWTVKSSTGSALDYENTGVPQWYYSSTSPAIAPATASSTPVTPLPSEATVVSDARHFLTQLGFTYTVASPNFSTSTTTTAGANGTEPLTTSTEDVAYTVLVGGVATDQTVSFSVGTNNVVAYASGPAFDVATSYAYPLESPGAGVAQLNMAQKDKFASSSSPPPIVKVFLNSDTISLQTYQLVNGTWWLLPEYHYQGVIPTTSAASTTGVWNELAINPSYVEITNSAANNVTP
jgi:hypothetical protein